MYQPLSHLVTTTVYSKQLEKQYSASDTKTTEVRGEFVTSKPLPRRLYLPPTTIE